MTPGEAGSAWWEDVCVKPGHYKKGSLVFDGRSNFFQFRALASVNVSENASSSRPDHLVEAPFVEFLETELGAEIPENGSVRDYLTALYHFRIFPG